MGIEANMRIEGNHGDRGQISESRVKMGIKGKRPWSPRGYQLKVLISLECDFFTLVLGTVANNQRGRGQLEGIK